MGDELSVTVHICDLKTLFVTINMVARLRPTLYYIDSNVKIYNKFQLRYPFWMKPWQTSQMLSSQLICGTTQCLYSPVITVVLLRQ